MTEQRPEPTRWILLILYATALVARAPDAVWPGRMWAEEATVYFAGACDRTWWETLTLAPLGYVSLYPQVASGLADVLVPLRAAATVTTTLAWLAALLPIWFGVFGTLRVPAGRLTHVGLAAILLLVLPNHEVWLNTINSQFYLAITAAVILVTDSSRLVSPAQRLIGLGIAGFSGVPACLLLPFFWMDYMADPHARRFRECVVLSVAAAVELGVVTAAGGRQFTGDARLFPWVLLNRQWVHPLLGAGTAEAVAQWVEQHAWWRHGASIVIPLVPVAVVLAGLRAFGTRWAQHLALAAVVMALVSFSVSAEGQHGLYHHQLYPQFSERYWFAPNVLLMLALWLPLGPQAHWPRVRVAFRGVSLALVAVALMTGATDYVRSRQDRGLSFAGPSWAAEADAWQSGRIRTLKIWPRPWMVSLPPCHKE